MKKILFMAIAVILLCANSFAADNEVYTKDIPYNGEKMLNVKMDFGMAILKVAKAEGDYIARIKGEYDPSIFKVDVTYDNNSGTGELIIKIDQINPNLSIDEKDEKTDNDWEIMIGDRCPSAFSVDAGMAKADLNFTGMNVVGLTVDAGMAAGSIAFNSPNKGRIDKFVLDAGKSSLDCTGFGNANFGKLVVDAGMASLKLDFSGTIQTDSDVELDLGMSSATITLNPSLGTRISHGDDMTSSISIPDDFQETEEGVYQSDNYVNARGHLDIDLDVSMGSVDFKLAQSL